MSVVVVISAESEEHFKNERKPMEIIYNNFGSLIISDEAYEDDGTIAISTNPCCFSLLLNNTIVVAKTTAKKYSPRTQ